MTMVFSTLGADPSVVFITRRRSQAHAAGSRGVGPGEKELKKAVNADPCASFPREISTLYATFHSSQISWGGRTACEQGGTT